MAAQLATVHDYRAAVAKAIAARPERAWALARLALEAARGSFRSFSRTRRCSAR